MVVVVAVLRLGMSPRIQDGGHPNFLFNPQNRGKGTTRGALVNGGFDLW